MNLRNTCLPLAILFSTPVFAIELPQIKGEWIQYDADTQILGNKLVLKAGGTGTMTGANGLSEITWKLESGAVKISVEHPVMTSDPYYTPDETTGESFPVERGVEKLELKFKKLDGLAIQWESTTSELVHFTENHEKPDLHVSTVNGNTRLIAARQLKSFVPHEGEVLSVSLPGYVHSDIIEDAQILVRLDSANVLTRLSGFPIGSDQLFWTIDQGSLRVADGKGYSVRFKVFEDDKFFKHLYGEVERDGADEVGDSASILVDRGLQALGFEPQSAIFKSCWVNVGTEYCFQKNRDFVFSFKDQGTLITNHGLWTLENKKLTVKRYRYADFSPVTELAEMLKCEQELTVPTDAPRCKMFQERSYELLNQDAHHLGVYRVLTHADYVSHYFHQFVKSRPLAQ